MQKINHLSLAHLLWQTHLTPSDWVVDATCGNGKDTLKLSQLVPQGGVIGLDIQEQAILSTQTTLGTPPPPNTHLFCQSHEEFPSLAYKYPIALIIYNLGYLPGGDKNITTERNSTLSSLNKALELLTLGGLITITCYPGHEEGVYERSLLLEKAGALNPLKYTTYHWVSPLHQTAPSLILIQKRMN